MDIRVKFAAAAALAVAAPLGAQLWLGAADQERAVADRERSYFEEATAMAAGRLDSWNLSNQAALKTMARIPGLMAMTPATTRREMQGFTRPLPWVRAAFATNAQGMQVARTDKEPPVHVGDRPYYKAAIERGFGRQVAYSLVTNRPTYLTAVPLAPATGADGGVIGLALDLDKISAAVVGFSSRPERDAPAGEQRFIAIEDGKLLAHSREGAVAGNRGALADASAHPLWAQRPRAGQVALSHYADASGARWVGAMRQSDLGWYVGIEAPESSFSAPMRSARIHSLRSLLIATLAAAALGALAGAALRAGGRRRGAPAWAGALLLGLAAGAPALGFFLDQSLLARSLSREGAATLLTHSTARSARKIDSWMGTNMASLEALAGAPGLSERAYSASDEDRSWTRARLQLAISQLPWVLYATITGSDGKQTLRSNEAPLVSVADRAYFKQTLSEPFGSQFVIARSTGIASLQLARAVRDDAGSFKGAAVYAVQANALFEQLAADRVGRSGFKFIVDQDGGLLSHPDKEAARFVADLPPSYARHPLWIERKVGDEVAATRFSWQGREFMGAIARAGNFYAASVLPMDEVDEPADKPASESLVFAMLCMALAATLGWAIRQGPEARSELA